MSRGRITAPPPPPARERQLTAPKMLVNHQKETLRKMFGIQADWTYERHRLKYVFDKGGEEIYVCHCEEGFDRRRFNMHIRDSFKEVA